MAAKDLALRSTVAIIELLGERVKIRLPDTPDGHAIGVRLSEILSSRTGVAILHRRGRRT